MNLNEEKHNFGKKLAAGEIKLTENKKSVSPLVAARMNRYAEKAGIGNFHLHRIRHTFARIVGETTESYHGRARRTLGHRNAQTTRVYVNHLKIEKASFRSLLKERISRK